MAVTRSSRTSSSTLYSKGVQTYHVHNEPPANSFQSISIEPGPRRYPFRHPERRRHGQRVTLHPTGARLTRSSKKLPAIPTNSAVGSSRSRSHRHSNSDLSQHRERPCQPICNNLAKSHIRKLKRFNKACIRSANETLALWESWDATDRESPLKMRRRDAVVTKAIQTSHYFIQNSENMGGDNKPKLYKHEIIQRLNKSVLRRSLGLPIV